MPSLIEIIASNEPPPQEFVHDVEAARELLDLADPSGKEVPVPPGGAVGKALVELLTERANANMLVFLREYASDKPTRKAAGKALYKLRSQGVDIPDSPPAAPPRRAAPVGAAPPSYLSAPDSGGSSILCLGCVVPGEGPAYVQAVLDDDPDLRLASLQLTMLGSQRRAQELIDRMRQSPELLIAQVPEEYVRARLLVAADAVCQRDQPLPLEWEQVSPYLRLDAPPVLEAVHPAWKAQGVTPEQVIAQGHTKRAIDDLLVQTKTANWAPARGFLRELPDAFLAISESKVIINRQQIANQVEGVFSDATKRFFTPATREQYARRFEDLAHIYSLGEDAAEGSSLALQSLAMAAVLRQSSIPPSESPALRAMLERLFDVKRIVGAISEQLLGSEGTPGEVSHPFDASQGSERLAGAPEDPSDAPRKDDTSSRLILP